MKRTFDDLEQPSVSCGTRSKRPRITESYGADLLHAPAMMAPFNVSFPVVLTIFDMYILRNPDSFTLWQRQIMKYSLPKILRKVTKIIAISQFTKREILDFYPDIPKEKIVVTLLGVNKIFRRIEKDRLSKFKTAKKINRPFGISNSDFSILSPKRIIILLFLLLY